MAATGKTTRRNARAGYRWARVFLSRGTRNFGWSLGELYGRPLRWCGSFRSRQASERIETSYRRLRNELFDAMSINTTPLLSALIDKHQPRT